MEGDGILIVSQIMDVNAMSFDQTKYKNDFNKSNYDRIAFNVPKGKKAEMKKVADEKGISINQLIINALEECYKLDLSKY